MIESFPLYWPEHIPRTQIRERSRFDTSQHRAQNAIITELNKMHAINIVISTNLELRRDGLPYKNQSRLDDPGVAVYYTRDGNTECIPIDKWSDIAGNMQAIAKTLKALRGLERWGSKDTVNAAFQGFKALPEQASEGNAWWNILGVDRNASTSDIKIAYRQLAMKYHPDKTDDPDDLERFQNIKAAYEQGLRENGDES